MNNKKMKYIKGITVMSLCTCMLITSLSLNQLSAQSQELNIEENVGEGQAIKTYADISTERNVEPMINIDESAYDGSKDTFSFGFTVNLQAESTNNQVTINLPKGILPTSSPDIKNPLVDYQVKSTGEKTTLVFKFIDTAGSKNLGQTITLSQKDFIRDSKLPDFKIEAIFHNNEIAQDINTSKTYTAIIDYNKEMVANVDGSVDGFFIEDTNAKWNVIVNTMFDIDVNTEGGKVILDTSTFTNMKIKEKVDYVDTGGNIEFPIKGNSSVIAGSRKLQINLPIEPDLTRINNPMFKEYKFYISGKVEFGNGKEVTFAQDFYNIYFEIQPVERNLLKYNLYEMLIDGESETKPKNMKVYLKAKQKGYEEKDIREHKKFLEDYFKIAKNHSIGFQAPQYIEFSGMDSSPDADGYQKLNIAYDGLYAIGNSQLGVVLKSNYYAKIKFDINGKNQLTGINSNNYKFENAYLELSTDSIKYQIEDKESELYVKENYLDVDFKIFGIKERVTVKQGQKDVLINKIEYIAEKDYKVKPKFKYRFDFANPIGNLQGLTYGDIIHIKEVGINNRFVKTYLSNLNLKFKYITNLGNGTTIDLASTSKIILSGDEWIVYYEIISEGTEQTSLSIPESEKDRYILTFQGDIQKVKYYDMIDISGNNQLILTNESEGTSNYSKSGFQTLDIHLLPDVINNYDIYFDSIAMYPGNKKNITFDISNIPEIEKVESITYRYIPDSVPVFQAIGFKNTSNAGPVILSYETTLGNEEKGKELAEGEGFTLGDNEYFSKFEFTVPKRKDNASQLYSIEFEVVAERIKDDMLDVNDRYSFPDKKMFEIVATEGENKITGSLRTSTLNSSSFIYGYNDVTQNAILSFNESQTDVSIDKTASTINIGTKNISDEIKLDIDFTVYADKNHNNVYIGDPDTKFTVVNPTFYIEIPKGLEFKNLILNKDLKDKKPIIKQYLNDSGTNMVKIEFYGNPEKSTGFKFNPQNVYGKRAVLENAMTLIVQPKKNSSLGHHKDSIRLLVDQKQPFEYFKNKGLRIKPTNIKGGIDVVNPTNIITILFESYNVKDENAGEVNVIEDKAALKFIEYSIQGSNNNFIDAVMSKENEIIPKKSVYIRSGEIFNTSIDIFNASSQPMKNFVMYIPIPKETGIDRMQWELLLENLTVNADDSVKVFISNSANPSTNEINQGQDSDEVYKEFIHGSSNLSDVTMIKVKCASISSNQYINIQGSLTNAKIPKALLGVGLKSEIKILYAYNQTNGSIPLSAYLTDTTIKGTLFTDKNENGVWDIGESVLSGKEVNLYYKDGTDELSVSDANGEYFFTVSSIDEVDYVSVNPITEYRLTNDLGTSVNSMGYSYFDPISSKAIPTLMNAEYLNAGFVYRPDIFGLIEIPKVLEMEKDVNDASYISAEAEINLTQNPSLDPNYTSSDLVHLPSINITPDASVEMKYKSSTFTAQVYDKDGNLYTDVTSPILQLKYGGKEADSFFLKTVLEKVPKDIGKYEGTLKFTITYNGE